MEIKEYKKPPSVADDIWEAIPEGKRYEAIMAAAIGLRRGIHPDNTLIGFINKLKQETNNERR